MKVVPGIKESFPKIRCLYRYESPKRIFGFCSSGPVRKRNRRIKFKKVSLRIRTGTNTLFITFGTWQYTFTKNSKYLGLPVLYLRQFVEGLLFEPTLKQNKKTKTHLIEREIFCFYCFLINFCSLFWIDDDILLCAFFLIYFN